MRHRYLDSLGRQAVGFIARHAVLGGINDRMKALLDAVSRIPSREGGRRRRGRRLATGLRHAAIRLAAAPVPAALSFAPGFPRR